MSSAGHGMDLRLLKEMLECVGSLNGSAVNGTDITNSTCGRDVLLPKAPNSKPK
ncbi:hypothetical protein SRHO_G00110570, partial [Serrasalmus rhombeus]